MQKIFALGLHKTGSTSLQRFLLANQTRLAKDGIFYPPVTPAALSRLIADTTDRLAPDSPERLNEVMAHNALAYRLLADARPEQTFPQVHRPMFTGQLALNMVRDMAGTMRAQSVIFCSEDLARAALHAPEIPSRFADTFGRGDVTIMATIRRPDDAIAAWQSQRLEFGAPFPALSQDGLGDYLGSVHFDFRRALSPWLDAFPGARVILTPYRDTLTIGGAARHFADACNLPPDLTFPENSNVSLPYALIGLSRQAFAQLSPRDASRFRDHLKTAATRLPLPANDAVDLFGPGQRDELYRAFAPIHDWLNQVSGRAPFFDDLDQVTRPRRFSEPEAQAHVLPAVIKDAETHLDSPETHAFLRSL
ncbi:hypothetical protein RXV86_13580 [Alisedimentitalea sp. MJ-SS2]|uniref:hypothetical protein n=1 Tax=Aliisedimentitalea sp. MJ-SS2 TaxID=3049795 RepID=UPI00290D0611|nr:hypothetical protein [Alisedimentitalea sp. MJ-SS2]MDU8928416.1 hypothetical protein [Alisedimentitalea sp. MJ-SS2]